MVTFKQKKAFDRIVENHGNISKTMLEVGYDKVTAKNPKNLTNSQGWKELMDEYLPDELLAKKHKALLNKIDNKGEIDVVAVKGGLDLAYKLKGYNAPEKIKHSGEIRFGELEKLSNEELERLING